MTDPVVPDRMQLWGGIECTVNRVGDTYLDQMRLSGHHDRLTDLADIASLGIRKLRYPILWERAAPEHPDAYDWSWSDARMAEIARLGMTPIIGLLHHGSGPHYTNLLDDDFPRLFAAFAAAVATRYPDVVDWTPINEPLTTARFSALYGHWYPHARDERSFWQALLNQIDGTRLAMRAIRTVNPVAKLIQTEDLGQTYAAPGLTGVAAFYNDRRWLTWDLLCGRVVPGHALWDNIGQAGFADRLRAIADDPCAPAVVGVNHYVTSDRYLEADGSTDPGYRDLVAARVMDPPPPGLPDLLSQAHARYSLPLALTECHLGCTRDEQMRWLAECWTACANARVMGIDVVALTAWALIGSSDWDSLLTQRRGHHECGVLEVANGQLRPTAQVALLKRLNEHGEANVCDHHPVLAVPGWWRRPARLGSVAVAPAEAVSTGEAVAPILVLGATGTLGRAFAGACDVRGIRYVITDRATLSLDNVMQVASVLDRVRPWAVVNAAGWVRIDDAETAAEKCHSTNSVGAIGLAEACDARGIPCLLFSSDQVFDGLRPGEYGEYDRPHPLNVYGESKLCAERGTVRFPRTLVVRTAAFFSPYDPHNFAMQLESSMRADRPFLAADDYVISPTYVPHLVDACLDLLIDEQSGLWHLSSGISLSWSDFAVQLATTLDLPSHNIRVTTGASVGWVAQRPRFAGLRSVRGRMLPNLDVALAHHRSVRSIVGTSSA